MNFRWLVDEPKTLEDKIEYVVLHVWVVRLVVLLAAAWYIGKWVSSG